MAIKTATNPDTGERVALVDGEWLPIAKSATNAEGAKAYLVNGSWLTDTAPAAKPAPAPAAPKAEVKAQAPVTEAPKAEAKPAAPTTTATPSANIDPTTGKPYPELRALPEPDMFDKFWDWATSGLTKDNKAKAANEYAALRTAQERKITLNQAYKVTPVASRPIYNPEGRPAGTAAKEAAAESFKSISGATTPMARAVEGEVNPITGLPEMAVPDIAAAAVNALLRTARTNMSETDKTALDRAITQTTVPVKQSRNAQAFANLAPSLGYSAANLVSSAIAGAAGTATLGPYGGLAAATTTSGTISYRASKDDFLNRLRDKLNDESEKTFGRKMNAQEWNKAKEEFEGVASNYAAWEMVPETASNLIFLKAFLAPIKAVTSIEKVAEYARRATVAQVPEQITETATGAGQNVAELKAGLTKEELTLADAFRQQFVQSLITSGAMSAGAITAQQANKFYEAYVEPRVRPGSALARAIRADLETFTEQEAKRTQQVTPSPIASIYQPATPEPPERERPELKGLQATRRPDLETEAPPDRTLSALEKARNEGIEVEAPPGPTLSAMERARNEGIEGAPVTPPIEARVQARTTEYKRQGYMEDDARLMAERDIAAEARQDVGGRAIQRQDSEDERRTAEGRAERAAMSMEAPSELPEPPSYVTEPSTDEYGTAVPSRATGTSGGPKSAFDRGLDTARSITGQLDAGEARERASLDANQRRIESSISAAFAREATPDLGPILGASWTRSTLARNPTPEEYQDAAYARMEELDGQRPDDAGPAFERSAAPAPAETKTEAPAEAKAEAPAATGAKMRRPTDREKSNFSASAVIDFGPAGQAVIAEGLQDVYIQDKKGNELSVRQWDSRPGSIKTAAEFPAFVPESLRQPIIDYQDAAYKNKLGTPETQAALNRARTNLQQAVAEVSKPAVVPAEAKPAAAAVAPEIQTAKDLLSAIDEGGIPLNTAKLNNVARDIGLDVSKSAKPEETIGRIRSAVERAAPTDFEPLELEAGRNESLEVEPSEIAAVVKSAEALTKAGTPRQRAPGAGRPKSETAKTPADRVAQSNALNKFNRDVALLIDKAKEFSQRQSIETFETPEEFEYKEAVRDMRADQMRTAIYGISQRSGMAQGYIDAKDYIRSLPEALRGRAKALHEGRVKLEDYHEIPPKPETLIEKERKSEAYKKAREEGKAKKEAERSAIDKGLAARRREQEASGLTNDEIYRIEQQLDMRPDPTFKELTTLKGALIYISESPNQLEAELAARLLQDDNIDSIEDTSLQVVETDTTDVDPDAKEMLDDDAVGTYVPYTQGGGVFLRGSSYGVDQGINNEIVLHEAMHASGAKKIAFVELAEKQNAPVPARLAEAVYQLRDLMDRARGTYAKLIAAGTAPSGLGRLAEAGAFTNIQEFYAYGLTDPDMKLFLRDEVPGTSTKTSGFDRFVDILMRLFGVDPSLKSGLKDLLLISNEIMAAKKPSDKKLAELARNDLGGPLAAKRDNEENTTTQANEEAKADKEEAKLNTPIFEDQLQAIGLTQKAARTAEGFLNYFVENYYDLTGTAREFWLKQVPTDALFRTMKRAEIKQGEIIKGLMREANTFKLGQMKLVESLGREWLALKSKEGIRLAEVMHKSTIARVDPSKDKSNAGLNRMWDALTPEARTVYNKVRDYYTTQARLAHAVMIQNVQNSQMNKESKEKLIETLENLYGEASRISPYFPLMRFGRFWLQTGRGDNLRFEMFETEGKRNTARTKYLKGMKRKGDARSEADLRSNKELSDGDDINTLRERMADDSDILKDVLRKISELGNTTEDTKQALARDVFQMHLMTLPETKFQKAFIHRKDVEGYSKDGLRSFVTAGRRMASQLAAIKYQPKMRLAFSAAVDSIEGKPTRAKDEALIKALENRVRGNIAPPEQNGRLYDAFDNFVHFATKYTFMYHLTDMRALMNNMWALPSRSTPVLTKHFGPLAVLKELGKFTRHAYAQVGVSKVDEDGNVSYTLPSFGSSALVRNDPLLQYAVEEMDKRGIATQGTQTFDLYLKGIGDSTSAAGRTFDTTVRISGALHQGSERITREVTFLTAFKMAMSTPRLGTKNKMTKEEAVEFAHDVTDEALYNFLPENMPSWTRNPLARLAIQFHKWAFFTSFYYCSNIKEMVKPLPGNTRRGAVYALLGSGVMGALGSGVTGVFGVSAIMGMYQMLANMLNDDDEEEDILKGMDITRWFNEVYLPAEYGNIKIGGYSLSDMMADGVLTTATGADFTSGLSEGSLYFRTTPDSVDFDSALSNSTVTISAPAVGTLAGMYKAGKAYAEGDTLKAVSKFIPVKTIRAPFDAYRLSKEGAKTPGLETKINPEEFSKGVLFMQALGYRPATLAKLEDADAFINKHRRQIETARSDIVRRLVKANQLGRDDIARKVQGEIQDFNATFRHSDLTIDDDVIDNYIESMEKRRDTTQRGMEIEEKFYQLYPVRKRAVENADRGR